MKNPFWKLAAGFYQKLIPVIYKKKNQKVWKELLQLHPYKNSESLYENYQIKKLSLVFVIWVIGIGSAICVYLCSRIEERLAEGAQLKRNEWGVGDYEVTLRAETKEWSRDIPFLIEERKLTEEEKNEFFNDLKMNLPELMKKNNQDLQHITDDLNLPSVVAGYPFRLIWSSNDSKRITDTGKINRKGISKEGQQVLLTVTAVYEEDKVSYIYKVRLLPEVLDNESQFFRHLEDELQAAGHQEETAKVIVLPKSLDGEQIKWEEVKSNHGMLLLLFTVLGSMAVCRGMDNDLNKSCEKRRKQLLMDYSGFVSKFRLYLAAGLNVKNAFLKMTADYAKVKDHRERHYLYEEMKIACHYFENGMLEEQVYQEFGKRCGEMRYRRFSFLLSVHLKQGNNQLLLLLEREADSALEDRRNIARKIGEEAGTKLLFPMMLMLIVVMFLILLPVYFDFGNI